MIIVDIENLDKDMEPKFSVGDKVTTKFMDGVHEIESIWDQSGVFKYDLSNGAKGVKEMSLDLYNEVKSKFDVGDRVGIINTSIYGEVARKYFNSNSNKFEYQIYGYPERYSDDNLVLIGDKVILHVDDFITSSMLCDNPRKINSVIFGDNDVYYGVDGCSFSIASEVVTKYNPEPKFESGYRFIYDGYFAEVKSSYKVSDGSIEYEFKRATWDLSTGYISEDKLSKCKKAPKIGDVVTIQGSNEFFRIHLVKHNSVRLGGIDGDIPYYKLTETKIPRKNDLVYILTVKRSNNGRVKFCTKELKIVSDNVSEFGGVEFNLESTDYTFRLLTHFNRSLGNVVRALAFCEPLAFTSKEIMDEFINDFKKDTFIFE